MEENAIPTAEAAPRNHFERASGAQLKGEREVHRPHNFKGRKSFPQRFQVRGEQSVIFESGAERQKGWLGGTIKGVRLSMGLQQKAAVKTRPSGNLRGNTSRKEIIQRRREGNHSGKPHSLEKVASPILKSPYVMGKFGEKTGGT